MTESCAAGPRFVRSRQPARWALWILPSICSTSVSFVIPPFFQPSRLLINRCRMEAGSIGNRDENHEEGPVQELQHRAKHVGVVESSKRLAETFTRSIESRGSEQAADRLLERASIGSISKPPMVRQATEQLVERAPRPLTIRMSGSVASQEPAEKFASHLSGTLVEKLHESVIHESFGILSATEGSHVGEHSARVFAESLAEPMGTRLAREMEEHLADQAGEVLAKTTGGKLSEVSFDRAVTSLTRKKLVGTSIKRIGDHGHNWVKHSGSHMQRKRSLQGNIGRDLISGANEVVPQRSVEQIRGSVIDRGVEHSTDALNYGRGYLAKLRDHFESIVEIMSRKDGEWVTSNEQASENLVNAVIREGGNARKIGFLSTERNRMLVQRVGRGVLVAIPVMGGIFACTLLKSDIMRLRDGRCRGRSKLYSVLFGAAAVADGTDAICHFLIALSLVAEAQTLDQHNLLAIEAISLICVAVSIVCAVLGEVVNDRSENSP